MAQEVVYVGIRFRLVEALESQFVKADCADSRAESPEFHPVHAAAAEVQLLQRAQPPQLLEQEAQFQLAFVKPFLEVQQLQHF